MAYIAVIYENLSTTKGAKQYNFTAPELKAFIAGRGSKSVRWRLTRICETRNAKRSDYWWRFDGKNRSYISYRKADGTSYNERAYIMTRDRHVLQPARLCYSNSPKTAAKSMLRELEKAPWDKENLIQLIFPPSADRKEYTETICCYNLFDIQAFWANGMFNVSFIGIGDKWYRRSDGMDFNWRQARELFQMISNKVKDSVIAGMSAGIAKFEKGIADIVLDYCVFDDDPDVVEAMAAADEYAAGLSDHEAENFYWELDRIGSGWGARPSSFREVPVADLPPRIHRRITTDNTGLAMYD